MRTWIRISFVAYILSVSCGVYGQSKESIDSLYIDFAAPDLTAFTLLGVNPNQISRPANIKEFEASMLSLASGGASIAPGMALEWAPVRTLDGILQNNQKSVLYKDLNAYRGFFGQLTRNFTLSLASLTGETDAQIAFGASLVLFDMSEPVMDEAYTSLMFHAIDSMIEQMSKDPNFNLTLLTQAAVAKLNSTIMQLATATTGVNIDVANRMLKEFPFTPRPIPQPDVSAIKDTLHQLALTSLDQDSLINLAIATYLTYLEKINTGSANFTSTVEKYLTSKRAAFKREHWNAPILQVGYGIIAQSPDQTWKALHKERWATFLRGSYDFGTTWLQLLGLVQLAENGGDVEEDVSVTSGIRLLAGSNSLHGSIEGGFTSTTYKALNGNPAKEKVETLRTTLGLEYNVSESLWLELAVGIAGPADAFRQQAKVLTLGNVKYAFGKEPRFDIP